MALCMIEDASTTASIYCQTNITNTMERSPTSSLEPTATNSCSFDFQKIDSTLINNQESTRKRQLSQNDTKTITDNSCRSQAVSINKNNESMLRKSFLCFLRIIISIIF
jgi:hypothetical protein